MTREEAREALGIAEGYTPEDVRKAYRRKAIHAHPDRPSGDAWYFRRLGEARDLLLSPETLSDTSPQGDDATSQDASQDASQRLHPLVREVLEHVADDASTPKLERILGSRAEATQVAVRTFLSVLGADKRKVRRKRKTKKS